MGWVWGGGVGLGISVMGWERWALELGESMTPYVKETREFAY